MRMTTKRMSAHAPASRTSGSAGTRDCADVIALSPCTDRANPSRSNRTIESSPVELDPLERHLLDRLRALPAGSERAAGEAQALWRVQLASRLCDFAARYLQQSGRSFYSIASAGQQSNAAVAFSLRRTD